MAPTDLDTIWGDDLFGRQDEAELLAAYIESVAARPQTDAGLAGFTIAVDAGYGEGKTFFLRRFAKHLSAKHPVAFVDAWADDLADEPFTAIVSTLQRALAPLIQSSAGVRSRWDTVLATTGRVATVVGKGLLKKGASLVIGASAVEGVDALISGAAGELQKSIEDGVKDSGKEAIALLGEAGAARAHAKSMMEQRVADFEAGRQAIQAVKDSLSSLVDELGRDGLQPPIVVIVDELDRCRPTYALKLLEQVKHLFDVRGIVFVFGMHGDQLAHSVASAYGVSFDAKSYLSRFTARKYQLRKPSTSKFVEACLSAYGIDGRRLAFPHAATNGRSHEGEELRLLIECISAYDLSARDTFRVLDHLQTCLALSDPHALLAPYLVPLIIGKISHMARGAVKNPDRPLPWSFEFNRGYNEPRRIVPFPDMTNALADLSQHGLQGILRRLQSSQDEITRMLFDFVQPMQRDSGLAAPWAYPRLLEAVGRFSASLPGG